MDSIFIMVNGGEDVHMEDSANQDTTIQSEANATERQAPEARPRGVEQLTENILRFQDRVHQDVPQAAVGIATPGQPAAATPKDRPGVAANRVSPPPKAHGQRSAKASGASQPDANASATKTTAKTASAPSDTPDSKSDAEPQPDYDKLFQQLVDLANRGDADALTRLRKFLDLNPAIWAKASNLTIAAQQNWIALIVKNDVLVSESLRRRLNAMAEEMKGPHPTQIESLLISQITTTWLATRHAEAQAAEPVSGSLAQAKFRAWRAESAQKRHLAAIKTLVTLRALLPAGLVPANPVHLFGQDRERA